MPDVVMPRLSDTMEEGVVGQWLKHEGDPVHKGDVLAEIETDKATMELEAYDEGVLTRILVGEGTSVSIGTPIAVIDAAEGPARTPSRESAAASPSPASPLARSLARRHGLDIAAIPGSGPGGRIVRADIEAAIARRAAAPHLPQAQDTPQQSPARPVGLTPAQPLPAAGPDVTEVPLTRVRRLTAERLTQSVQQVPHFSLTRVVHADALLAFRTQVNADPAAQGHRVSLTDLLVKACARALATHPEVNASWGGTRLLRHHRIHIGVAVAVDDGLVVPVIHDADQKTLTQVSREIHDLAERARADRLSLSEITGGTFTVSNLGMYGVDHFTAVINPPQAAILAVGAATAAPVARDGRLTVGTTLTVTLSIDHRVLDGAAGAGFLADLVELLEHPLRIVL